MCVGCTCKREDGTIVDEQVVAIEVVAITRAARSTFKLVHDLGWRCWKCKRLEHVTRFSRVVLADGHKTVVLDRRESGKEKRVDVVCNKSTKLVLEQTVVDVDFKVLPWRNAIHRRNLVGFVGADDINTVGGKADQIHLSEAFVVNGRVDGVHFNLYVYSLRKDRASAHAQQAGKQERLDGFQSAFFTKR